MPTKFRWMVWRSWQINTANRIGVTTYQNSTVAQYLWWQNSAATPPYYLRVVSQPASMAWLCSASTPLPSTGAGLRQRGENWKKTAVFFATFSLLACGAFFLKEGQELSYRNTAQGRKFCGSQENMSEGRISLVLEYRELGVLLYPAVLKLLTKWSTIPPA